MNSNLYRRATILVAGALTLFALSSSNAFAAGAPIITNLEPTEAYVTEYHNTVNTKVILGAVNPNGASTNWRLEYSQTKSFLTVEATEKVGIGSGTKPVGFKREIKALLPNTIYYMRITAENSNGTTTGSPVDMFFESGLSGPGRWYAPVNPANYASSGTFTINFAGLGAKITCNSGGSGKIADKGGIGDNFSIALSGCGVYFNGNYRCSASIGTLRLNERLIFTEEIFTLTTPEECPYFGAGGGHTKLVVREPFTATKIAPSYWVQPEMPILLESSATFGTNSATITDSSMWHLTGEYFGQNLGYYPAD